MQYKLNANRNGGAMMESWYNIRRERRLLLSHYKKLSFVHVNSQVRNVSGSICRASPQPSESTRASELCS